MRRYFMSFVVILVALFQLWAGDQQETRLITVTGYAEINVEPDEVMLVLGVETCGKDVNKAKKKNDERLQKIIALAKKYKIESVKNRENP